MASLARALQGGKHGRFLDDPGALGMGDTLSEGNKILGHVFGSKDVSRNVAANAAQKSGLDMGMLKKMLPLVATMVMGGMSKKTGGQASASGMGDLLGKQAAKIGAKGTFVASNVLGLQSGGAADRMATGIDKIEKNTRPLKNAKGVTFT